MPLTFQSQIPEKIKKRLLLKLRIENIQRIKIISLASFVFLFLFMVLDYLRFSEGKIVAGNALFFSFLNHLFFSLFLIPLVLIEYHKNTIAIGKWKHTKSLIYGWTIFVGLLLITMAILSLIVRDSLTMYTMYMIIANFGVLMLHKDRMVLNGISFAIILVVCVVLNYQHIELLLLNILETSGVTLICFIVSNQLFNAFVKETYNEKILEEKSIFLEDQNKKIEALDKSKSALYTNITHEFRTPLTVILGMTNKMNRYFKDRNTFRFQEAVNLVNRNGRQLLRLINQMLDLSKLESKAMPIYKEQGDILLFIKYLFESFHSFAESKNIRMHFSREMETFQMDFDREKIQQILSNLLSNAIKFSPKKGLITLHIGKTESTKIILKVSDTGIGIAKENIPFIFDRFYQINTPSTQQGTGIGLALTKELVHLLEGTIQVHSILKEGTTFTIVLPVTRKAPFLKEMTLLEDPSFILEKPTLLEVAPTILSETRKQTTPHQILIVEDNIDVISYLKSCLEETFQLAFAQDGQEGIDKAIELVPDIIISDVMMPKKDGFELCTTLKTDTRTSHIPIILLTAKAAITDKIAGLERGADAYLAKPFEPQELDVRLRKLIELRNKLQSRYANGSLPLSEPNPTLQLEDEFVLRARQLVLDNLDNSDFSVALLSKNLFLSRQQVHRKITALTGLSAQLFIRDIRLQEAKKMLLTTNKSITAIAFDTGFKEVAYFSNVFAKTFGHTPSFLRK